ncbi:TPA: hypothetical protein ACXI3M_006763, partial [Pseudomonas aeruginosa]
AYYREGFLVLSDALKTLESEFSAEFIRTHRKALVRRSLISMFKRRPDDTRPAKCCCSEPRAGFQSAAATRHRSSRRWVHEGHVMYIKKDVIEVIKYAAMMAACSRQSWGIYPMNQGYKAMPFRGDYHRVVEVCHP